MKLGIRKTKGGKFPPFLLFMIRGITMKLTESKIKEIIKEELEKIENPDAIRQRAEAALGKLSDEEKADVMAYFSQKAKEDK